jgi:hypothetical protein
MKSSKDRHMKRIRIFFTVLLLGIGFSNINAQAKELPAEIVEATKAGEADQLSAYFNSSIELILPQKTGIFSKPQAAMVMKDFFKKNKATHFSIIHEGNRQNASFAIGNYTTEKDSFRIYYLTKKVNNQSLIHQLRIEKQND